MRTAVGVAYIAAYVFLDWVSYVHPVLPLGITPWNPPPGLSVFLLLRYGMRYWPALFVAALAADIVVRDVPAQIFALIATAAIITMAYVAASALLVRRLRMRVGLDTARDLGMFFAVIVPTTLAVAVTFVAIYTLLGSVPQEEFLANVTRYWIGDLDGILVLAPALLIHLRPAARRGQLPRTALLEIALQTLALLASLFAVLFVASSYGFSFFSLLFLPLTWIAARWGMHGATLALAAIQIGLITMIQTNADLSATFIQLQSVMLVLCVTGLVLGAVVSQRQRVEAELREKQAALAQALRFAAAGETTTAMAHELNQPIAALSNYLSACQLLARGPQTKQPMLDETLAKAVLEVRRAGDTVHRIRDFFKRGARRPQSAAPTRIVEDAVNAVRRRAEQAGIRLAVHQETAVPEIFADPLQVETALQNVLHNAIDALDGHAGPRTIDITMSRRPLGVEISVHDNGPGVADEIAPHVFEPFHTSRADGMGLGLAISRTLLRANGGDIRTGPGISGGARFIITLPVRVVSPAINP